GGVRGDVGRSRGGRTGRLVVAGWRLLGSGLDEALGVVVVDRAGGTAGRSGAMELVQGFSQLGLLVGVRLGFDDLLDRAAILRRKHLQALDDLAIREQALVHRSGLGVVE